MSGHGISKWHAFEWAAHVRVDRGQCRTGGSARFRDSDIGDETSLSRAPGKHYLRQLRARSLNGAAGKGEFDNYQLGGGVAQVAVEDAAEKVWTGEGE